MAQRDWIIHIDFPALDRYVRYLQDERRQQEDVDQLTAKIKQSTHDSQQSRAALERAIKEK